MRVELCLVAAVRRSLCYLQLLLEDFGAGLKSGELVL